MSEATSLGHFSRGAERRYIPRWSVSNKILYRKEKSTSYREAASKDITCAGACLLSEECLLPQQKLSLVIYLCDDVAVQIDGTVMWQATNHQPNHNLIGIRFENTSSRVQELILEYAFEYKKEALSQFWFRGW